MAKNQEPVEEMDDQYGEELEHEVVSDGETDEAEGEATPRGRQRQPKPPIREALLTHIATLQEVIVNLDAQEADTKGQADLFVEELKTIGQVGGRLRRLVKPYRATFNPNLDDPDSDDEPYGEDEINSFWNDYQNEH